MHDHDCGSAARCTDCAGSSSGGWTVERAGCAGRAVGETRDTRHETGQQRKDRAATPSGVAAFYLGKEMAVEMIGLRGDVERIESRQLELITDVSKLLRRVDWLLVAVLALGVGSLLLSFVVFVVVLIKL